MKYLDHIKDFLGSGALGAFGPWPGAIILLIIGYFVAKFLGRLTTKVLGRTNIDDKLANLMGSSSGVGLEKALGKFVFIIAMLTVLIAVLDMLKLQQVTKPLTDMVNEVMGAIPNILKAGIILAIGVFIAKLVKSLVYGVLTTFRLDERLKLGEGDTLAKSISSALFFLIILMILPTVLGALALKEVSEPMQALVGDIMAYLPRILTAAIIMGIGYLIAHIVQKLLSNLLQAVGFNNLVEKFGYRAAEGSKPPSIILSYAVMTIILVIMATQALDKLQLPFISGLSGELLTGFFLILGGLIILGIGIFAANFAYKNLVDRNATLATVARIVIIIVASAMALQRAQIAPEISTTAFEVLIKAVGIAIGLGGAIAIGLSFGLGGRENAHQLWNKLGGMLKPSASGGGFKK
ncbi:MAG: mechanosensitive ion channel [Verrucomicrobiota bacterium]